jgi:putative CocE/NonD family hydrolase
LLNPGEIYKLTIDVWATSNVFKKGHILRLEVSSSNFPRFDRNLNTGASRYLQGGEGKQEAFVSATNSVLHDAEHPSALMLPLVAK